MVVCLYVIITSTHKARVLVSVFTIPFRVWLSVCGRLASSFAYIWRGLRVVGSIVSGNAKASFRGTATVGLHVFLFVPVPTYL